jgi:hypothetical protein
LINLFVPFPFLVPRHVYLSPLHHSLFVVSLIVPNSRTLTLRHNMTQVETRSIGKNCHFVNDLTSQDINTKRLATSVSTWLPYDKHTRRIYTTSYLTALY